MGNLTIILEINLLMNLPLIHTSLAAMVDFLLAQTIGRKTITRLGVLIQPQLLHQNVLEVAHKKNMFEMTYLIFFEWLCSLTFGAYLM